MIAFEAFDSTFLHDGHDRTSSVDLESLSVANLAVMSVLSEIEWGLSSAEQGHSGCSLGGFSSFFCFSENSFADGTQKDELGFTPDCCDRR